VLVERSFGCFVFRDSLRYLTCEIPQSTTKQRRSRSVGLSLSLGLAWLERLGFPLARLVEHRRRRVKQDPWGQRKAQAQQTHQPKQKSRRVSNHRARRQPTPTGRGPSLTSLLRCCDSAVTTARARRSEGRLWPAVVKLLKDSLPRARRQRHRRYESVESASPGPSSQSGQPYGQ